MNQRVQPFTIYAASNGNPLPGILPTFEQLLRQNEDGSITDLIADQPDIDDHGGGWYGFELPLALLTKNCKIFWTVDLTVAASIPFFDGTFSEAEWVAQLVLSGNRRRIPDDGDEENKEVIYAEDGTTIVAVFGLYKADGVTVDIANPAVRVREA